MFSQILIALNERTSHVDFASRISLSLLTKFYFISLPVTESAIAMITGGTVVLLAAVPTNPHSPSIGKIRTKSSPQSHGAFSQRPLAATRPFRLFLFPLLPTSQLRCCMPTSLPSSIGLKIPAWIFAFGISLDALKEVWKKYVPLFKSALLG